MRRQRRGREAQACCICAWWLPREGVIRYSTDHGLTAAMPGTALRNSCLSGRQTRRHGRRFARAILMFGNCELVGQCSLLLTHGPGGSGMSYSQREDYLLRQAKAAAEMLARIIGLRTSGEATEARAELERAYAMLLGSQAELMRRVDASTAATLLNSTGRIQAFASLLEEEASLSGDAGEAATLRARAAELAREAERR